MSDQTNEAEREKAEAQNGQEPQAVESPFLNEEVPEILLEAGAKSMDQKSDQRVGHTLRVSSLYKSNKKKRVVKGVDFFVKTGEVLGLLGPNGAGKTTSFYMIVGFYKPTSGEIFLDDKCITPLAMYKRAQMGISYLPQEASVFRKLTVEDNIWAILENRRDLTHRQKKALLEELIEEFSITRIRRQYAYTLSGGERRRCHGRGAQG